MLHTKSHNQSISSRQRQDRKGEMKPLTPCDRSNNMRFQFTDSERTAVAALKEACDKEAVAYGSLFELAKYVLVSHSCADDSDPKADEKRLKTALKRIKKRNKWNAKYGLEEIEPHAAMVELDKACPGYVVTQYTTDKQGRVVVAHHHAHAPIDYVTKSKENLAKFYAAEQYRFNLGAADMEEARNGVALATITDGELTMKRALRYLRLVALGQENLKDMHPNRIRNICSQVPAFLSPFVQPAKKLLPSKIASRINVVGSMKELHQEHLNLRDYDAKAGVVSAHEWAMDRRKTYNETLAKLTL